MYIRFYNLIVMYIRFYQLIVMYIRFYDLIFLYFFKNTINFHFCFQRIRRCVRELHVEVNLIALYSYQKHLYRILFLLIKET